MVIGSSKQEISHQIFQTELTLGPSPWPPWQRISLNITDTRYSVVHTYTQHATHYTEHCLTLYSDTMHIVQNIDIDAHYTEHWYKLHRTLMHIVQNIFTHSTTHLYTLHNTFIVIHIAQNINTLVQNIIYWTLCRTLHFTHTQTTHTLNISWDISLTPSCRELIFPI